MLGNKCYTLQSSITDELVYLQVSPGSPVDVIFRDQVGNCIEINDTVNFPDRFYSLLSQCTAYIFCPDCYDANPVDYSNRAQNIVILDEVQCPTPQAAYVLANCRSTETFVDPEDIIQSPNTLLVTSSALGPYVGMTIKIEEYPDECYSVFGPYVEFTGCPCEYYTVTEGFADCECCIGGEVGPPKPQAKQKPVKKFYHITDTDCEIKDNTKFGENYYRFFTGLRYGIKNCCGDIDLEKLWIKKELSDYSRINPPTTCAPPPIEVCPDPCPAPEPLACLAVNNVIAAGTFN
jgi:hypothetical protein